MIDKATLFKDSNRLFINRQYEQALPLLRQYGQLEELTNLERLRNKKNIADCLLDVHRGRGEGEWAVEFRDNLQQYWQLLEQVDTKDISSRPLVDFFAVTLQFHLEVGSLERLGDTVRETYREFAQRSRQPETGLIKVRDTEFLDVVVAEIERERRNFARPDHAQRATALANAVLEEIGDAERFRPHRTAINNLLADLAYFFPLSSEADNERYKRVSGYLEQALQASPHDDFARIFKSHVDRLAATTLQIKRFGHDTLSQLANVRQHLERMEHHVAAGSELHQTVLAIRREIRRLTILGRLVEREQPATDDRQEIDPSEVVRPLLQERGWPKNCLECAGTPAPWEMWPDYVRIALENLLRNTVEAYGRHRLELPPEPCRITIDYETRTITVRDWAGGVNPALGDVFAPYVSSKGVRNNTGLGLTQAREALEVQSPKFRLELAEPQPQGGAEFCIHIPILPLP
jgi:hypothetical protein